MPMISKGRSALPKSSKRCTLKPSPRWREPKASPPAGLAREYFDETDGMVEMIDAHCLPSSQSAVKLEDALYRSARCRSSQLAWTARNPCGRPVGADFEHCFGGSAEAGGPAAAPTPRAPPQGWTTAWATLEEVARGPDAAGDSSTRLSPTPSARVPQRSTLVELPGLKDPEGADGRRAGAYRARPWSPMSGGQERHAAACGRGLSRCGEGAPARQYAAASAPRSDPWLRCRSSRSLVSASMMLLVSRRVTDPLRSIQQAMLKVPEGDFSEWCCRASSCKDAIDDVSNASRKSSRCWRTRGTPPRDRRGDASREVGKRAAGRDHAARNERQEAEARAQAKISRKQGRAVRHAGRRPAEALGGRVSFRLGEGFSAAYRQIKDNFNAAIGKIEETIGGIKSSAGEVTNASKEISTSTTDLSPAHRGAGRKLGTDLRVDGRNLHDREEERRERPGRQQVGGGHPIGGRSRR